ncbi:AsmA family protein [Roseomonas eburnea]|uniref:AsmA family protein n=1 Tax=Neoroseomonas eburnea TaxID=1346889 RepID=A0A9X9X897_9PROT|nr:AsmA family protein [Neoroseomonas eburnea]MBR0679933.1 AsmA family protein [Neoroseomonas eburnea]
MGRRTKIILGILAGIPMLAVATAVLVLPAIELAPMAAGRATVALGRKVTIGSLRVSPGLSLGVELRDAQLDNIEGGSRPAMAEVASLSATLDLLPLLRGEVVLRRAAMDGFTLYLERAADRRANWHFGERPATPPPAAATPPDRSGLPMIHDLRLTGSEIVFRTTSGKELRTRLDTAAITADALDQPARLTAAGSYSDVPVTMEATLGSIATLRDARIPFPIELNAASSAETTLTFRGTATDPLNVDGAAGSIRFSAATPAAILAMAGAGGTEVPPVPIALSGRATRSGDVWRLTEAEGALDGAPFAAPLLELTEGGRGQPDAIVVTMDFTRLDVNRLLGARPQGSNQASGDADLPLVVPEMPDPLLRAELGVQELVYARLRATDVRMKAEMAPARIAVESLGLVAFGARFDASGELLPAEGGGAGISATARMTQGDVDTLRRAFGLPRLPLAGQIEAHAAVAAEATTLNAATARARISVVAAMTSGSIAREVIEMASTDVRALFRTSRGMTRVSCLLAAVDVRAGRGEAAPVRIRAGTGTVSGLASFDLNREWVDLIIGSQRETTNFFALDIPVRVSGSFSNPDILPAQWSSSARARMESGSMAPLPPDLRDTARRNPCYSDRSSRR